MRRPHEPRVFLDTLTTVYMLLCKLLRRCNTLREQRKPM